MITSVLNNMLLFFYAGVMRDVVILHGVFI